MNLNILFYILCYDDHTENVALSRMASSSIQNISKIVRLPPHNKYLEFYMYTEYLPSHKEEWIDKDYVGTLSWNFQDKVSINLHNIGCKLCVFKPDIFSFFNVRCGLFSVAENIHPNFRQTWRLLFHKLGFSSEEEIFPKKIPSFFCNYWIAKPRLMEDFIEFANSVKTVIDHLPTDSELYQLLNSDGQYKGRLTEDKLMDLFQKPFYILQPFILERLICFFVQHRKYKWMF